MLAATGAPSEGIQSGDKSHGLGSSETSGQSPKRNGAIVTLPLASAENSDEKVTRNPDVVSARTGIVHPFALFRDFTVHLMHFQATVYTRQVGT